MSLHKQHISVEHGSIERLLQKYDETVSKVERLDGKDSFCNPIYGISCLSGQEYVLKVVNPLPKWEKRKTTNEAYVMMFLREHTSIPIPKIFEYSISKELLGFEYILMEKILGRNLQEVFEKDKRNYLVQIADIIAQMKEFKYDSIGGFSSDGSVTCDVDSGQGPFSSFKDWVISSISGRFPQMEQTRFKKYIPAFKTFYESIEDEQLPIILCHGDLAPKNMIERDGKIVGVFDFEWAGAYPYIYDAANYEHDFNLSESELAFFHGLLDQRKVVYKMSEKLKDIKTIESLAMIFVSYQDWHIGAEEEGEKEVVQHERTFLSLLKKYHIDV